MTGRTNMSHRPARLVVVIAAACLLLLSACSDELEPVPQAGPNETANEPSDSGPTTSEAATAPRPAEVPSITGTQPAASVVALVAGTEQFSTLSDLLDATGVAGELEDGTYTVFAPTNEAFSALGDQLDALREESGELADLLRMHAVPGRVNSGALSDGDILETITGGELEVMVDGGTTTVNGAEITLPDIEAANGVVHGVDGLVTVPDETIGNPDSAPAGG